MTLFEMPKAATPVLEPITVDKFAGGGGASTGLAMAMGREPHFAINHCPVALSMHEANHPETEHLTASVYTVDPRDLLQKGQKIGVLWASPDCTQFSRAKGGTPIKKGLRFLAWSVVHWVETLGELLAPDIIFLENVVEFQGWDDFQKWKRALKRHGYQIEFKVLCAADYGAPTIRTRLFMVARKDGKPIRWPEPTHGDPKSAAVQEGKLKPWKTAGSIIDWSVPMPSIFMDKAEAREWWLANKHLIPGPSRPPNRPLKERTLERVAKGLKKYVIDAKEPYFISYAQHGGASRSAGQPMHTLCASSKDQNQIVAVKAERVAAFMAQHNTGMIGRSMNAPLSTITTRGTQQQAVSVHMMPFYGTSVARSAQEPLGALTAGGGGGKQVLVASFLQKFYGKSTGSELSEPVHTLRTKDCHALVTVEIKGEPWVITDICMRLLTPREQFRAQSFPDNYIIDRGHDGRPLSKEDQTRMCGNSVPPVVAQALAEANPL